MVITVPPVLSPWAGPTPTTVGPAGVYWNAPMSGVPARATPRWSVAMPVPVAPAARAAELAAVRAMVGVGPPLSVSPAAAKFGLVPATSAPPGSPLAPVPLRVTRLFPLAARLAVRPLFWVVA